MGLSNLQAGRVWSTPIRLLGEDHCSLGSLGQSLLPGLKTQNEEEGNNSTGRERNRTEFRGLTSRDGVSSCTVHKDVE